MKNGNNFRLLIKIMDKIDKLGCIGFACHIFKEKLLYKQQAAPTKQNKNQSYATELIFMSLSQL